MSVPTDSPIEAVLAAVKFVKNSPVTLIIDGPSGAGKTTIAADLRSAWPAHRTLNVVHLDDLYPGWQGLAAASDFISRVLVEERASHRDFDYEVWDWALQKYSAKRRVSGVDDLIVEGCGALTRATAGASSLSVWLDADENLRKKRALSRGDEDFAAHWDEWDIQFTDFIHRENPQALASLTIGLTR